MKARIIFSLEGDEPPSASPERIREVLALLQGQVRPEDEEKGLLKAFGRVAGNAFGAEDVLAVRGVVQVLTGRLARSIEDLRTERDALPAADAASRRAYEGLIEGGVATKAHAERLLSEFVDSFDALRLSAVEDAIRSYTRAA